MCIERACDVRRQYRYKSNTIPLCCFIAINVHRQSLPSGGEITEIDEQIEEDVKTTDACARLGVTVHAFGDGATWDNCKEGVSGWSMQLQREGGKVVIEDPGRH